MEREDAILLNQMLWSMRKLTDKLGEAYQKQDLEALSKIKKELLDLQKKVSQIL